MKVLAAVVTYYPEEELLRRNVSAFIDYVDEVLIWENTPEAEKLQYRFVQHEKVEYCGDGVNSISHALNHAWHYAQRKGYDFLLTMDQDSVFLNIERYLETTINLNEHENCLVGPAISTGYSVDNMTEIIEVDVNNHLITSGMLVPIRLLNGIGGYCEDFEIEAVDLDICIRARAAGYRICRNTYGELIHKYGNPYTRKLFGKTFIGANYSSRRLYGIFRNHMILYRRFKTPIAYKLLKGYFIHFVPRILLWEKHKFSKLRAIFCGIKDGALYKM